MLAPIALFAFNRPDLLQRTLDALAVNALAGESALTIFCDGPRHEAERMQTDAVRAVARQEAAYRRFAAVTVVERPQNMGCAPAVIAGLQEMFALHERLIVLEDDILCSPHTLTFLNAGLTKYEARKNVWNIAAWSPSPSTMPVPADYPYDVDAIPRFNCWGWASWRDRFALVDWDVADYAHFASNPILQRAFNAGGEDLTPMLQKQMAGRLSSWAIRADYARFKHGCVGINPVRSYTTNIGMGSGTHTTEPSMRWDNDIAKALPVDAAFRWPEYIFVDASLQALYKKAYREPWTWRLCARKILAAVGLLGHVRCVRDVVQTKRNA